MLPPNINPSQSILCISAHENEAHVFIFSRFHTLLFYKRIDVAAFAQLGMQNQAFYKTRISLSEVVKTTLVPSAIFLETELTSYFSMVAPTIEKKDVAHQLVANREFLFSTSKTNRFFQALFPHAEIFPEVFYFIKNMPYYLPFHKKAVVLHRKSHVIYLLAYDESQLTFMNSFEIQGEEDVAYYTLLVYNQLSLNQQEVPLLISGQSETGTDLEILNLYVLNIEELKIPLNTQNLVDPLLLKSHAPLFITLLCE